MTSTRATYVQSLEVERKALASRKDSAVRTRRLAEIDAQLDQFAGEPTAPALQTAAGSPPPSPSLASKKAPRAPRTPRARKA